jgi:uncharacterized protein with LGFP repeats
VTVQATLGLLTAVAAVALLMPTATATPETDDADAITAAWEDAGGDDSDLGPPQGDVYPAGEGFAEDFVGGKMFYTPATGAHALYGPVLEKYESLGGAADSDLGFPNVDQGVGLVNPDSRSVTFSAGDNPVIFYTPDNGAFVVRGAINAAWDKLGSSSGALGVPVGDESANGDVVTQKFSDGEVSWNTATKAFTTVPPELAGELGDVQVPADDAGAAINRAWRASGGAQGPLGDKQGEQYPVGDDGAGQDFAGGKIFYTPATGANAIGGDVLAKYESLGGPAGSDLGFPATNEADGPVPGSRVSTFSGDDKPVIFFTPDHGAYVVRNAMKAAWDQLGGAAGDLGPPVGDQTVDGDVIAQEFDAGRIFWDRATNRFTTEPEQLASQLTGLQVPGEKEPSASAGGHKADTGFTWHWWWLAVAIGVLVALPLLAWALLWWRQRGTADRGGGVSRRDRTTIPPTSYDAHDDDDWPDEVDESDGTVRLSTFPGGYGEPSDDESAASTDFFSSAADSWRYDDGAGAGVFGGAPDGPTSFGDEDGTDDLDADTDPTPIPGAADFGGGRHAAFGGPEPTLPTPPRRQNAAMHLPFDDPYQVPDGFPVKANIQSGLYYTPGSALYHSIPAEIWFTNEEVARLNGFAGAD